MGGMWRYGDEEHGRSAKEIAHAEAQAEFEEMHCTCDESGSSPTCPIRGHGDPELIGEGW